MAVVGVGSEHPSRQQVEVAIVEDEEEEEAEEEKHVWDIDLAINKAASREGDGEVGKEGYRGGEIQENGGEINIVGETLRTPNLFPHPLPLDPDLSMESTPAPTPHYISLSPLPNNNDNSSDAIRVQSVSTSVSNTLKKQSDEREMKEKSGYDKKHLALAESKIKKEKGKTRRVMKGFDWTEGEESSQSNLPAVTGSPQSVSNPM